MLFLNAVSARANAMPADSIGVPDRLDGKIEIQPERIEWYTMFSRIPDDWVRFSRVTFRSSNIPAFLGMTFLTGGLVATDDETWKMSKRWYDNSRTVASISDVFEKVGDGMPQFELSAAFALVGLVANDQRALRTSSQLVESILATGVVIQVLKHSTGRESPFVSTRPGGRWMLFPNQIEYHKHVPNYDAYPSGHIATTMATVTVLAENYPEATWIRPIGYLIVAGVGIGMANTGIHWYSDYPLGIALGYMFGMIAAHPEGLPAELEQKGTNVTVGPVFSPTMTGLAVTVRF
jgi:membrane-associated PAP2 superfamily phosphatase